MRDVHRMLDELEAVWRSRLDRFGAVLADLPFPVIAARAAVVE